MNLYCTGDNVGGWTGGSKVTFHESEALKTLGETEVWDRKSLWNEKTDQTSPWWADGRSAISVDFDLRVRPRLAHFYAGTFSSTIQLLKERGCKITYTAAAHDIKISQEEHQKRGFPYGYKHLTDPELLKRYLAGYLAADVLIVPSEHSANVMRGFGYEGRIERIPHGVDIPERVIPYPKRFTVGYMGSCSAPDKGLVYLLQAWKELNYKDATLLLAGHDSNSPYVRQLIEEHGGGNVQILGWVKEIDDFYRRISLLVQPSCSEGFGLEVIEAMAHGRPALASLGAGASDCVPLAMRFMPADPEDLAASIRHMRDKNLGEIGLAMREEMRVRYEWGIIREMYRHLWSELLEEIK